MFKTYLEIISQEKYKEFEKKNQKYLTSEKYKQRLKELLKRFFTNEDGKIVNTIIIPYTAQNIQSLQQIDKNIIQYLNNHGYKCTEESYLLGYCLNNKNKEVSIIDVLKMIKQYNIEKLEQDKKNNPQYSIHYDNRIKAKQNFKENYLTYYQNFNKNRSKIIAFTWLPRAIASMSTDVGWRSCMNLYDGGRSEFVFSTIEAGAFIAWLVQKGDEEILDNPQARILIKAYVSKKGKIFWYPEGKIYGTAPQNFHTKVKEFVIKQQEIYLTDEDLEDVYDFDKKQHHDMTPFNISPKSFFKERYIHILENKIKNNTQFTIDDLEIAIEFHIDNNLIKKVLENLKDKLTKKEYTKIAQLAYKHNNYDIINLFLLNPLYNKLISKNKLFLTVVKANDINMVKELLKQNIDPSYNSNEAMYTALKNGFVEIIKLLLQDKRLKISKNEVFQQAAQRGYVEVVKLLLQDKKVDPSDIDNYAIRYAAEYGRTEVVKLLLQDSRVDPSANRNYAIRIAAERGYVDIVKLLLQDERVDPSDDNNYALRYAAENGHIKVVKLLLQDERVDPSDDNNYALLNAIREGQQKHIEIIKLLLQDPRINLNKLNKNDYSIQFAIKKGHIEVIKLLLQDPRMRSLIDINYMIQVAQKNGNTEIIKLLQQYK